MTKPVFGHVLGKRLCDVLGIDPNTTESLTIHCEPNDVAKVTVRRLVLDHEADALTVLVEEYDLAPTKDGER